MLETANYTNQVVEYDNPDIRQYGNILDHYGLKYRPALYYWQVGEISISRGWVLHLSVIRAQIPALLHKVIPELIKTGVTYSVIQDYHIAGTMLDGALGFAAVGKMINIYPNDEKQALSLAKRLIPLTAEFSGPKIPTDCNLGSIVYTSFEQFSQDDNAPLRLSIPFKLQKSVNWPFTDLAPHKILPDKKLLNGKYYPISSIKQDSKGDVMRAIYLRRFFQVKMCLIKQGRGNMFADDNERDSRDRLKWQYELYQRLSGKIPMPEMYEYFEQGGNGYLAMELIQGHSLGSWINVAFQDRCWQFMPAKAKIELLDRLLVIIGIIERMHASGYIHRDITPENFLLDRNGKICLIDMELTWDSRSQVSSPPFRLGTQGFMSPEQQRCQTPTEKEDIYGLGALMLVFFLNLSPMKFEGMTTDMLRRQLLFFTKEGLIADLVSTCMSPLPDVRPELAHIKERIVNYRDELALLPAHTRAISAPNAPDAHLIYAVTQSGLKGLSMPLVLSPKQLWASRIQTNEIHIGNYQLGQDVYPGWHTGVAGPLWIAGLARGTGFDLEDLATPYIRGWEYLSELIYDHSNEVTAGLYFGSHGIAMALVEGIRSGLLEDGQTSRELLGKCLEKKPNQANLAEGLAGKGLALLYCSDFLEQESYHGELNDVLREILGSQLPEGHWKLRGSTGKDILIGLDYGSAGVVWFLLCYYERYADASIEIAIRRALAWLNKTALVQDDEVLWPVSTRSKRSDKWHHGEGTAGVILVFLKAYELFKEPVYRTIVEGYFSKVRPNMVQMDFSLRSGLAGMGELYLEAFRVLRDKSWQDRADWIANIFLHTFRELEPASGLWLTDHIPLETTDLFPDNSGILHFLLRYQYPDKIGHPLTPRPIIELK